MSAESPRPGQEVLATAIEEVVTRALKEWDLTLNEVVGVLHVAAARIAHQAIDHNEDF